MGVNCLASRLCAGSEAMHILEFLEEENRILDKVHAKIPACGHSGTTLEMVAFLPGAKVLLLEEREEQHGDGPRARESHSESDSRSIFRIRSDVEQDCGRG